MDDTPSKPPAGGAVEPARTSASRSKDSREPSASKPGLRFEMRDHMAEVTYVTRSYDEMVANAERIGVLRFDQITEDGTRTRLYKVGNGWQRPLAEPSRPPSASKPEPAQTREAPIAEAPKQDVADREALKATLQAALDERYVIKRSTLDVAGVPVGRTEYRYRGDLGRIAFTESASRLATDTNSPSVARSMLDVAQSRNWHSIRVTGHDDFRRNVWLEATVRGVKAVGYEPLPADLEALKQQREARAPNRIEPIATDGSTANKQSSRGGTRKAVIAALEAVLVSNRVPEPQREAVLAAAQTELARRTRAGEVHRVKIYDAAAPSRRTVEPPAPRIDRSREQAPLR